MTYERKGVILLGVAKKRVSKGERPAKTAIPESGSKGEGKDMARSPPASPPQRIQPGGGYLRSGNPGNKGGSGRTPDEIKGTFRQILDEHGIPWVIKILSAARTVACPKCGADVEPPAADGVAARLTDTLTRAGVGSMTEVKVEGGMSLVHDTNT